MSVPRKNGPSRALTAAVVILALILVAMVALALWLPDRASGSQPDPTTAPSQPTASDLTEPSSTAAPTDPPTEPPTEAPTEPPTVTMRVAAAITARTAPAEDAPEAAALAMGTLVEVSSAENGWSCVEWEGQACYLPSAVLRQPDKYLVVIDAGHQRHGNYDKEPNGPGSEELKAKVTSGTQGTATGLEEYKLNLMVAQKLQTELEARGYEVVMVRTEHDVDISNAERAAVANELYADAFIRIHANSSENAALNGALTICQTPENPYNSYLYAQSQALSELVLDEMCAAAGCRRMYIWETDTMSGINWCQVPVTIVEMGFMSNPEEDRLLADDAYQDKLTQGIANGIDAYFGRA